MQREKRTSREGIDGLLSLGREIGTGGQVDRVLLVQCSSVGDHPLALEQEQRVEVGELGEELGVELLRVARIHALQLSDIAVAVDRTGREVGRRTAGKLRFERREHPVDDGVGCVLALPRLHDQRVERRRELECLAHRRQDARCSSASTRKSERRPARLRCLSFLSKFIVHLLSPRDAICPVLSFDEERC